MAEVLEVGGAFLIGVFGGALLVCFSLEREIIVSHVNRDCGKINADTK